MGSRRQTLNRNLRALPGGRGIAPTAAVDRLVEQAPAYGWTLLFADRHPYAGGPEHYAAYLTDDSGYEVELVAQPPPGLRQMTEDQTIRTTDVGPRIA
jgi:hypothetical protein